MNHLNRDVRRFLSNVTSVQLAIVRCRLGRDGLCTSLAEPRYRTSPSKWPCVILGLRARAGENVVERNSFRSVPF